DGSSSAASRTTSRTTPPAASSSSTPATPPTRRPDSPIRHSTAARRGMAGCLAMNLPVGPPVEPMLAKLARELPTGDGWSYEPKWDGFRCIVFRDHDEIELGSRNGRPLNRYFPEILDPLRAALPDQAVIDGELVIATPDGLNFDLLSLRIHPAASRVAKLAAETPSSF